LNPGSFESELSPHRRWQCGFFFVWLGVPGKGRNDRFYGSLLIRILLVEGALDRVIAVSRRIRNAVADGLRALGRCMAGSARGVAYLPPGVNSGRLDVVADLVEIGVRELAHRGEHNSG
jgi:hypothetical protein